MVWRLLASAILLGYTVAADKEPLVCGMSGARRSPDKPKRLRSEKEEGDDEDYVDAADELP